MLFADVPNIGLIQVGYWLPISLILVLTMDNYSMNITRLSPFFASTP